MIIWQNKHIINAVYKHQVVRYSYNDITKILYIYLTNNKQIEIKDVSRNQFESLIKEGSDNN